MSAVTQLACACGQVQLAAHKTPIISAECHCNSCRAAGTRIEELPAAPPVLAANGGTRLVLYRKDRIRFIEGAEWLKEFRLTPQSKTRRVVATCCNSPVFLEVQNGHWLSLYGSLWPDGALPPVELRTMTSDLPEGTVLSDDVPNSKRPSISFVAKLLGAWIAMGFRVPKITVVNGELDAQEPPVRQTGTSRPPGRGVPSAETTQDRD